MIDRSFEDLRFTCGAGQALDCEWLPSAQHCAALAYCRSLFLMREDIRFAYEGYRKNHILQRFNPCVFVKATAIEFEELQKKNNF